jgi:hypothetical protein
MAITIPTSTTRTLTLDEYIDTIAATVDVRDVDSIAESAPLLRMLANDRDLIVEALNNRITTWFDTGADLPGTSQTIYLASGKDFYVRANIWPSMSDIAGGRVYLAEPAYDVAHDHNFNFLTTNYFGPGYTTEIYEFEYETLEGYIGEPVDLRFLERVQFAGSSVMLYRASKDMHVQFAPEDLSITLNLMLFTPEVRLRDQYHFDVSKRVLMEGPAENDSARRASIIELAGHVGNADTEQLLSDIALKHPSRRARLAAFESMDRLQPARKEEIWKAASRDRERLVSNAARRKLDSFEN